MRALTGTTVGSAPGLVLPFAVTWVFTAGARTDAYFLAYAAVTFVLSLTVGVFEPNSMRLFGKRQALGCDEARSAARVIAFQGAALALAGFVLIGGAVFAFARFATDVDTQTLGLCLLGFLPLAAAAGSSSAIAGAHYVSDAYAIPTSTIAFRSLAGLIGLGIGAWSGAGVVLVAVSAGAGEAVRAWWLDRRLIRSWTATPTTDPAVVREQLPSLGRDMWKPAGPHVVAMLVVAMVPLIDRSVAATLGTGAVTVVDLAEKLYYVPNTILFSSLVLVTTARWAEEVGKNGGTIPSDLGRRSWLVAAPAMAISVIGGVFVLLALPLAASQVAGIDTDVLASATAIAMLDLAPALLVALGGRLLALLEFGRPLLIFSAVAVPLNAVADIVGASLFGVRGVLAATVFSRVILATALFMYLALLRRASQDQAGVARTLESDRHPEDAEQQRV